MKSNAINIQDRTFEFACRIVKLYRYMVKQNRTNEALCRQLVRAGTSIGANLEEASAAQSRADFISKCNIALKEARETYYWLRLFKETEIIPVDRISGLTVECNEIVAILTSIVKKTRSRVED
ncbi:MAG: four helix bundle protein [Planctomycetaceae bacterium]|nr:four helix bundle protein [Planctomycetaceae bacterium]